MHIIVIGGGVAGLGASLGLARAGHRVTLLERDATPLPDDPIQAFANWDRRGAPQVRHSHAFLARLRNILRDRLPDVLEALLAEGTEELSIANLLRGEIDDASPRPGDDDLTLLACRRITFEWVLHRAVLNEPGIRYRDGCTIEGVLATDGVVTGVRLAGASGEEVHADLVVDAAGRRSKLPAWLEAAGFAKPDEESEPCGIFYCSRFYRLRDDVASPERETTIGGDIGYLKYAVFHGDGRIFSVTFAAAPEDKPLRQLLRTEPFERAARSLPATSRWVDPAVAEPISEVHAMDGLRNTRRFPIREDDVLAPGVIAIGDAAIHTNPLYGRGCSLALVHAYLLIDAIAAHPGDLEAIAQQTEAGVEREIVPWYAFAVAQDREAANTARQQREDAPSSDEPAAEAASGDRVDPRAYMRDVLSRGLIPALRLDATVLRAFMRSFNLLDPPGDLLQNPDILQRVLAVYQNREQREEPVVGPGREDFIAMLGQAPKEESNHA
jgi:2-polyprenyl-6-methoxyphenol hydroxylase-like FAD-dependent oxidoreductase